MQIGITPEELFARARADLRIGLPVVLRAGGDRLLAASAETLPPARLARFAAETVLVISARRAETLKIPAYDGDSVRLNLPREAKAEWVRAVIDPARDLDQPLKGPFATTRGGEAGLHRAALRLCKAAHLLPAALCQTVTSCPPGLTEIEVTHFPVGFQPVETVSAQVPLALAPQSRLHVFRQNDAAEEHYAIETGAPDRGQPVLCRLHSACFTGDVLGSLRCDCGSQLQAALAMLNAQGGVLLYLSQEGRGIGMANKMRAYALQDQGFDTFEANHRLGFEDDERDFQAGAMMLKSLGFFSVRLLTNNPAKVTRLQALGIEVAERVPLVAGQTAENAGYLAAKARKSGHFL